MAGPILVGFDINYRVVPRPGKCGGISMEEKIFVGFGYGNFVNDRGAKQAYCNVFVLEPFAGEENEDYHYGGQKAVKYGCTSPELFVGIDFGQKVMCFFDSRKKISYMVPADKVGKAIPGSEA